MKAIGDEAEMGVVQLQARDTQGGRHQQLEAGRLLLSTSEGAQPCGHPDFGLLVSSTATTNASCVSHAD